MRLASGWSDGHLELLVATSYHEASGGRRAGDYTLSYRFVPAGKQASRTAEGLAGVIIIPVTPPGGSQWATVTVNPSDDIAALWPDLDYRDFALWGLTLSAVSTGDHVQGYFDYLRFSRTMSGETFLDQQIAMEAALAPKYRGVVQQQGLEVSTFLPHLNWFGGNVSVPGKMIMTASAYRAHLQNTVIPDIHAAGGLVSYNHPFGYNDPPELPAAQQHKLVTQVAAQLLPAAGAPAALGADLLEVGYNLRQGVNLAHHVGLWDVMSRNAVFLTGNGANDDHYGQDWQGIVNNWFTSAWAASTGQADLLGALAAGRAWCGSLSKYRGSLDLLADGSAPMGSVSVSRVATRQLTASANGVPAGGNLQILQGRVDYAGTADPQANTKVIGSYTAAELAGGSITQPVDNREDSFVRSQVVNASGVVVGLSNPVWLLRSAPPGGIPAPRSA